MPLEFDTHDDDQGATAAMMVIWNRGKETAKCHAHQNVEHINLFYPKEINDELQENDEGLRGKSNTCIIIWWFRSPQGTNSIALDDFKAK